MASIERTGINRSGASEPDMAAVRPKPTLSDRIQSYMPQIVMAPSVLAALIFTYGFVLWTLYLSFTDSTLFPNYELTGLKSHAKLWANIRWQIAYTNFFVFGFFYVIITTIVGLALAIFMDQRIRAESFFRSILLYPMAKDTNCLFVAFSITLYFLIAEW